MPDEYIDQDDSTSTYPWMEVLGCQTESVQPPPAPGNKPEMRQIDKPPEYPGLRSVIGTLKESSSSATTRVDTDMATGGIDDNEQDKTGAKAGAIRAMTNRALTGLDETPSPSIASKVYTNAISRSHLQKWIYKLQNDLSLEQSTSARFRTRVEQLELKRLETKTELKEVCLAAQQLSNECETLSAQVADLQDQRHGLAATVQKQGAHISNLQARLEGYKAIIDKSTKPAAQTSDDAVGQRAEMLFRHVREFVVRFFRTCTFDFQNVPVEHRAHIREYIPRVHALGKEHTYSIAVAVISGTLTRHFACANYFGRAEDGPVKAVIEAAQGLQPQRSADTKPWLEISRTLLQRSYPDAIRAADANLAQELVCEVEAILADAMQIEWTAALQTKLAEVFAIGLEFFRLLHQQPVLMSVDMILPCEGGKPRLVNPEFMDDVEEMEEEEELAERRIEISVFPLVRKIGDERGENMEVSTIVSKAKIVAGELRPPKIPRKICAVQSNEEGSGTDGEDQQLVNPLEQPVFM